MAKKLPVVGRPIPRPLVATVMSLYVSIQLTPWLLTWLQFAKLARILLSLRGETYSEMFVSFIVKTLDAGEAVIDGTRPQAHLTFTHLDWVVLLGSCTCVGCSFLNRLLGHVFLGYDLKYW